MWNGKKQSNIFLVYFCDYHVNWWQSLTNFCGFWMQKSADYDAKARGEKETNQGHSFALDYEVILYQWEDTAYYSLKLLIYSRFTSNLSIAKDKALRPV